ncbi:hypothetical protein KM043_011122 [Ampulex compressa]|nr:hypothetical protein KM043_011122 [Ampulex compressa]
MAKGARKSSETLPGILAESENRPDATPEWECKPPHARESVTRIGYFPERDYKQTNTPRDEELCACDPCPPFQDESTAEPAAGGQGEGDTGAVG